MWKNILSTLKNKYLYLAMALMFLIPSWYKHAVVRIDITSQDSLPHKVWVTKKNFTNEEYVLFIPPLDKYTKNADFYLKKIACRPNQKLETKDLVYLCDGKPITKAKTKDLDGNDLKYLKFNLLIPKDMFFVIGTHPHSYDSKYIGLISKKRIVRGATPLADYF